MRRSNNNQTCVVVGRKGLYQLSSGKTIRLLSTQFLRLKHIRAYRDAVHGEFDTLLRDERPLEAWAKWLNTVIDSVVGEACRCARCPCMQLARARIDDIDATGPGRGIHGAGAAVPDAVVVCGDPYCA